MAKTQFVWTVELAALAPPWRGDGKPLRLVAPAPEKLFGHAVAATRAKYPKALREYMAKGMPGPAGPKAFKAEADALTVAFQVNRSGPSEGTIFPWDIPNAHKRKIIHGCVDRWVTYYGVHGATEIVCQLGAWLPAGSQHIPPRSVLPRLRAHLARAPDEDYACALGTAKACFEERGDRLFAHWMSFNDRRRWPTHSLAPEVLAYLFPDHRPFFQRAVDAVARHGWKSELLLASVATKEEMARLAGATAGNAWHDGLAIPRTLELGGLPFLVAYAEGDPSWYSPPAGSTATLCLEAVKALTAYVGEGPAKALAHFLPKKVARKTLVAYFGAHPELAESALSPIAASGSKGTQDVVKLLLKAARATM